MALMKRISGIRGTIGGFLGTGLTPYDIVVFASGYAQYVLSQHGKGSIVVGRDARISGEMVSSLVIRTLQGMGLDVVDLGLATTPTTAYMVSSSNAIGGIILGTMQRRTFRGLSQISRLEEDKKDSVQESQAHKFAAMEVTAVTTGKGQDPRQRR